MKKISILLTIMIIAVTLSACGAGAAKADVSALCGTWVRIDDDMTSTYVINADGTFSSTSESSGDFAISITYEGTYTYNGTEIVFTYTELEYDNAYDVKFDGSDMLFDNGKVELRYVKQ